MRCPEEFCPWEFGVPTHALGRAPWVAMSWQDVRRKRQKKDPPPKAELQQLAAELRAALFAPRQRQPPGSASASARRAGSALPRKPEWTCTSCGVTNFLDRHSCRRCAAAATAAAVPPSSAAREQPPAHRRAAPQSSHAPETRLPPGSVWTSGAASDADMGGTAPPLWPSSSQPRDLSPQLRPGALAAPSARQRHKQR